MKQESKVADYQGLGYEMYYRKLGWEKTVELQVCMMLWGK